MLKFIHIELLKLRRRRCLSQHTGTSIASPSNSYRFTFFTPRPPFHLCYARPVRGAGPVPVRFAVPLFENSPATQTQNGARRAHGNSVGAARPVETACETKKIAQEKRQAYPICPSVCLIMRAAPLLSRLVLQIFILFTCISAAGPGIFARGPRPLQKHMLFQPLAVFHVQFSHGLINVGFYRVGRYIQMLCYFLGCPIPGGKHGNGKLCGG